MFDVPVNNYSVISGRSNCFLCISRPYQYFSGVNVSLLNNNDDDVDDDHNLFRMMPVYHTVRHYGRY